MLRIVLALVIVLATMAPTVLAITDHQQNIVSRFWKLDQASTNLMAEVARWSEKYETNKIISAASNEELRFLMRSFYKIAVRARRLKKSIAGVKGSKELEEKFRALYGSDGDLNNEQLFNMLMGALTDIVMYEQIGFFLHLCGDDKIIIKKLNETIVYGLDGHFKRWQQAYLSVSYRKQFAKALTVLDKHRDLADAMIEGGAGFLIALRDRMDTEMVTEIMKSASFWDRIGQYLRGSVSRIRSRSRKRRNWMEYHLSKIFGNAAGALNVQKFMSSISKTELKRIRLEELQPGDVIVEKTAGAITDKFIPGHFGHVAMYFGRPDQLSDVKLPSGQHILSHPDVVKHLDRIEAGESVVEAIRPGTTLINIEHWTITDLAVLRPVNYPREKLGQVLLTAIQYVDTVYDFAFDVNTRSIIVCSELPYQAFRGINFRVAKQAGRWTISPDDVAVLAGPDDQITENRPFQLKYFNHETKEVPAGEAFELYKSLLEAEKSRYDDVPENDLDYSDL